MKTIALEGPSFAGKTSTMAALQSLLPADHYITYRCYVDEIDNIDEIPPARTQSASEQLNAFKFFMQVEGARVADLSVRASSADLVLLDRSVDTLLAHAYALDQIYGYGVHNQARVLLTRLAYLRPDQTFYLDASHQELGRRRGRLAAPFDSFLLDPAFIRHFRDYFTKEGLAVASRVIFVHAEQSQSVLAQSIVQMLL